MSKKKIVIPTEEEVAEYSGQQHPPESSAGGPDGAQNAEAQVSTGQQPPSEQPAAAEPRSEADEFRDKYLRAVAELANYRKRAEKDREESLRYATTGLVRSLLTVLDDLDRVIASANEHAESEAAFLDGVKLTRDNFRKALAAHHVVPIEAQGQPFDPVVHEAMMQQPSDQYDVPTVLQVLQEGFKLFDRVIRPARVVVSKPPEEKQTNE